MKFLFLIIILLQFQNSREDKITYYKNGSIFSKGVIINALMQGKWVYFYENGNVKSIENYKDGFLTEKYYEYFDDRSLKIIGNYNHKLTSTTTKSDTLQTGAIVKTQITTSIPIGIWYYFNKDGTYSTIVYPDYKK
jgi:antitoxin component YwqK of YwqJK toxin-antitoxin module